MRYSILIVCVICFLTGCNKNTPAVPFTIQLSRDIEAIDSYLAANSITAVEDTTGVRYVIHTLGTGPTPTISGNCIRTSYSGKLISDGSEFDHSTSFKVPLSGSLITGWKIVFPKLPQGTKATMYIPSVYAYGTQDQPTIPANSNLMFDVELLDVYLYNSVSGYCYDEPLLLPEVQLAKDVANIDKYLADNNISAQTDASGFRYSIESLGMGTTPTTSNCVMIKYTGKLLTGSQFDQNLSGFKSPLIKLIAGLKTGLQLLPNGTKATFYIPSGLAYGPYSSGSKIPANANVIFEIELVDVNNYNATTDTCD